MKIRPNWRKIAAGVVRVAEVIVQLAGSSRARPRVVRVCCENAGLPLHADDPDVGCPCRCHAPTWDGPACPGGGV